MPHLQQRCTLPGCPRSALDDLKSLFTSALILIQPDPLSQFRVEVAPLPRALEEYFTSKAAQDSRINPSAFFSRRLTPSEPNYGIGDHELLAIKLALKEWRNWLEGSATPFPDWTDHKNLEYTHSAKCLNPRQA